MSSKPLLEKIDNWSIGCSEENICKKHIKKDVVEALKKFKSARIITVGESTLEKCLKCKCIINQCNFEYVYYEYKGKIYCLDCWFKECFGELPE